MGTHAAGHYLPLTPSTVVLSIVVLLVGATPTSALAQVPRVGLLALDAPPISVESSPFTIEMKARGHVEGRTYVVELRHAGGDDSRFPALARELLDHRPAVIWTACGTAQRAIRQLSATLPVVAGCADPKNFLGEVASLSRPGGHTTGYTFLAPESAAKRLQLLKELKPTLSRVGVLHNRVDDWGTYLSELEAASAKLGLALTELSIARPAEVDDAFATAVRQGIEALVVFPDVTNLGARSRIAALAKRLGLLTIFDTRVFVTEGGLISYGPDWFNGAFDRTAAEYVDKILKGAAPGELPIQQPTQLELVINMATARALGLIVPRSLLLRADALIE